MELGKKYEFKIPKLGSGTIERLFIGQVIQICNNFIVFQNTNYTECFLKCDLNDWGYKEV